MRSGSRIWQRGSPRQVVVQVETLVREWNYYLGATCGLAQVSASGKALNLELFEAGNFTVSLLAIRSVIYGGSGSPPSHGSLISPHHPHGKTAGSPASSRLAYGSDIRARLFCIPLSFFYSSTVVPERYSADDMQH